MEIEYGEFSQIIERINTAGPLFKKNGRAYEKLFGGPFKRKDEITSEDQEFSEVKQLANEIESIIILSTISSNFLLNYANQYYR